MKRRSYFYFLFSFLILWGNVSQGQIPQTISYQGVLTDAEGKPLDGNFTLTFKLYERAEGGSPVWQETQPVVVSNGLFNVILGKNRPLELPFDVPYWLGITVGTGPELQPRIQLTSAAYSLNTRSIADSSVSTAKIQDGAVTQAKLAADVSLPPGGKAGGDLVGTYPNPSLGDGVVTTDKIADGAVTATKIASQSVSTSKIQDAAVTAPKIAGGQVVKSLNNLTDEVILKANGGATISTRGDTIIITAGTNTGSAWSLTGNSGTTSANFLGTTDERPLELRVNNQRGLLLQPNGLSVNLVGGTGSSVSSGVFGATIAGGASNRVTGNTGTVGGGFLNQAGDNSGTTSDREAATVSGGRENIASGALSVVGGGGNNVAGAAFATISGGGGSSQQEGNKVTDDYGTVGGGTNNQAGDGSGTSMDAGFATVAGGSENLASGFHSIVGGGQRNTASGAFATVAGGTNNIASGDYAAVLGGGSDHYAVPSVASGKFATVAGGSQNTAAGNYSFAAGRRAKANHAGTFVWADSTDSDFSSTAPDQFLIRAGGGVGIGTNAPSEMLTVAGRIESTSGGFKFPDGTVQVTAATSGSAGWSLSGNANTNSTDNFVGTTDQTPLQFRVNNRVALRLEPNNLGPNLLGGSGSNTVAAGVNSATISGGGQDGFAHRVTDNFGTIGGGGNNQVGNADGDVGNAMYATVSGGANNEASGHVATIGGGLGNIASNTNATIAGGIDNNASGEDAAIGGGNSNAASGKGSTVSGGSGNDANALYATVGGGWSNAAHAAYATIAGGGRRDPDDPSSGNRVADHWGTVGGGGGNLAGTDDNQPNNATFATVSGGASNQAKAQYATISGGVGNVASGIAATVPGGDENTAAGDYSFAAGLMANAVHNGTFVWADDQVVDFTSTAEKQFLIRAAGGVGIGTNSPEAMLHVAGGDIVLGDDKIQNTKGRSVYLAGHVFLTPWSTGDVAYLQARRGNTSGDTQLQFRTTHSGGVVEAMRITNTGNVGIGTQSPGTNLHVRHSYSGETPDNVTGLFVENSGTANDFFVFQTATAGGKKSFSITNAGNVGIGTTEPGTTLQVAGHGIAIANYGSKPFIRFLNNIHGLPPLEYTETWLLQANEPDGGSFRIRNESDNIDRLVIDTNGNVIVNGQIVHSSDVRLKTHIKTIPDALNKVLKLRGVEFEWKRDSARDKDPAPGPHIGFIAQEVETVFPELVTTGSDGYKSVAYAQVTAILIEAVKEQQKIIAQQKVALEEQKVENAATRAELNTLKSKMTDLTARIMELEAAVNNLKGK